MRTLQAKAALLPNVTWIRQYEGVELISDGAQVTGLIAQSLADGDVAAFFAPDVVLATGGITGLYTYASNAHASKGEAIAMAWRAGAAVENLEFVQFHPTAFQSEQKVAAHRASHVWLDISHQGREFVEHHFPNLIELTRRHGCDLSRTRVPVSPAAHYTCGGVAAALSGQTSVAGLYAIGEVANWGLHGANRLAGNSLLECVVMGQACADAIAGSSVKAVAKVPIRTPAVIALVVMSVCSVVASRLGVKAAAVLPTPILRKLFGVFMVGLASKTVYSLVA